MRAEVDSKAKTKNQKPKQNKKAEGD